MSQNNNTIFDIILDKIHSLDNKVEKVDNELGTINTHLAVYNVQLEKHIEGVQLARKDSALLKEYIDLKNRELDAKLDPIAKDYARSKAVKKFLIQLGLSISFFAGLLYTIMQILNLR